MLRQNAAVDAAISGSLLATIRHTINRHAEGILP
jgi:hypothetical protein